MSPVDGKASTLDIVERVFEFLAGADNGIVPLSVGKRLRDQRPGGDHRQVRTKNQPGCGRQCGQHRTNSRMVMMTGWLLSSTCTIVGPLLPQTDRATD